ncbi:MAG: O-antigen ligase family protein [Pseudomonadota bacterium]|nr:O-antigen ligase family protein [Pseudomonadota bacterium]
MAVEFNRMSAATRSRASEDMLDRWSTAFACFAFIYLYSYLGDALPKGWGFPLWPSYFYVLILIFTGTILAISPAAVEAFRQHRNFIFTLLVFVLLEGARAIFTPLTEDETQLLITNIEYVLVTISFVAIFSLCKRLDRIIQVVGLVVAVSAGINLIEYYLPQLLPVTFTSVPGRAAGFAENPNDSATYICLPLPLVAFFAPRLMRYMWYAIALAGIVVTFSRGGMALWVTAVVVTEALKHRERTGLRFTGMILLTIQFLVVALVLAYAVSAFGGMDALFPDLDNNTRARVSFTTDDNGRLSAAEKGIDMFLDAPLFGKGVGSTRAVPPDHGPHNMFVLMLAELGLVGGIWIAAFLLSIARYGAPFGLLVVIMFSVSAAFTHNHFEWPAVGMLFALYLVVAKRYER